MKVDLLVVGAGPAGCAAALAARRRAPSLRVLVVDSALFPRDKLCAGAITGGGLHEMELAGLELRVAHVRVDRAAIRIEGRAHRIPLPRAAAVVRRREWDADLLEQVRAAGAEVVEGAPVTALGLCGGGGGALAGSRRVAFRAAVAADGAAGASRRLLGLPPGRRVPLREVALLGEGEGELLFDLDASVPGYAWRFPGVSPGEESVGLYSLDPLADASERLSRWLDAEATVATGEGRARSWSIRVFEFSGPVGVGPVLLAGEALGVDPLAGEGIRYALWSGRIAGDLAARVLSPPLPRVGARGLTRAYPLRLAATRSGVALALGTLLAPRLYREPVGGRFRRMASDRQVAEALAALVSGAAPAVPLARLAARYLALARGAPEVAPRSSQA